MNDETFRALIVALRATLEKARTNKTNAAWPPPASDADIAAMEQRLHARVSPSYRRFLSMQDGWPDYAFGFTIVGTRVAAFETAMKDIALTVDSERDAWIDSHGEPTSEAVMQYEQAGDELNPNEADWCPYVPGKMHIATDFNGGLLFLDPERADADGEMEVFRWYADTGTQARFISFEAMLHADLAELGAAEQSRTCSD